MRSETMQQSAARDRIARLVDVGLPLLGVTVVLAAVALGGGGWGPLWMAVAGLLMVEAGVWRLGSRVMHERRYTPLRREVRRFIGLARELHHASAAVRAEDRPATRQELEQAVAAMRDSVDRMVAVAAMTEEEFAAESAEAGTSTPAAEQPARAATG